MKRKKLLVKSVALLLILMMSVMTFTACSGSNSDEEKGQSEETEQTEGTEESGGVVPTSLKISGGTTGGSWNIATTIVGQIVDKELGLSATVIPGAAYSNLSGIQTGEYGLSMSKLPSTWDGYDGVEPFTESQDKVMNMGFLYDEATHIIVAADSGIESVEDLAGKKLTTFAPGNAAEIITRQILEVYEMSYADFSSVSFASLNDAGEQFKDGLTDVLCFASALPVSVVMDIASVRDIKLLEIPDDKLAALQEIAPAIMRNVIPAGTYEGQTEDINTIGNAQHFIVSSDLDTDFVYDLTKAIVENLDQIKEGHAAYSTLTPEAYAKDLGIPVHPGAEKYFKEEGLMQ
jgi:hypothetical protein